MDHLSKAKTLSKVSRKVAGALTFVLAAALVLGALGCGESRYSGNDSNVKPASEPSSDSISDDYDAEEDGSKTGYEEGREHEYQWDEYSPSVPDVSAEDRDVPEEYQDDWESGYESGYEQGLEDEAEENRVE